MAVYCSDYLAFCGLLSPKEYGMIMRHTSSQDYMKLYELWKKT